MGVAAGVKGRGNKERLSGGEAGRKRCSPRTVLPPGRPAVLQQIGADSSERDASSYLSVSLSLSVFQPPPCYPHTHTPPKPRPLIHRLLFGFRFAAFCGVTSTFTAFPSAARETWGGGGDFCCRVPTTKVGLVQVGEGRGSRQDPVQLDAVITS